MAGNNQSNDAGKADTPSEIKTERRARASSSEEAGSATRSLGQATTVFPSMRFGDGGALDPEYEAAHREVMGHDIDAEQHQDHDTNGSGAQEENETMARRLQEQEYGATRLGDRTEHWQPEDSDDE